MAVTASDQMSAFLAAISWLTCSRRAPYLMVSMCPPSVTLFHTRGQVSRVATLARRDLPEDSPGRVRRANRAASGGGRPGVAAARRRVRGHHAQGGHHGRRHPDLGLLAFREPGSPAGPGADGADRGITRAPCP